MIILGLTGSIGMGKSTAAQRLKERNVPVIDADQVVHDLYSNEAVPRIEEAFPGTVDDGVVNRAKLSRILMDNPDGFKKLEAIVHPMVRQKKIEFVQKNASAGSKVVVIENPLLFEGGLEKELDAVIVVSADDKLRRERVMQRPGMTEEKLETIISRQVPDSVKREKADFIVDTSGKIEETWDQIDKIIDSIDEVEAKSLDHWQM